MTDLKRIGVKRGRKRTFTCEDYLNAIKACRSLSPSEIAHECGVSRWAIQRFEKKKENKDCVEEGRKYIAGIEDLEFTKDLENLKIFSRVPIIEKWDQMMIKADVSAKSRKNWIGGLMHLCKYLDVHPDNLTLEEAANINVLVRDLYREGEPVPKGLNYGRLRESIRGFFMRIHGVAPLTLNNMGVTKEAMKGQGRYANQKVDQMTRAEFEKALDQMIPDKNDYLETLNVCKFMFYTGSRISATLDFSFRRNTFNLDKDVWSLRVIDKGTHGGLPWTKYLVGHALDEFKDYCSMRFKIPVDELERELPRKVAELFPTIKDSISNLRKTVKEALKRAGLPYDDFPPLHIWRHTFAQEFLSASNWNYELCAELGGWKTTHRLKKHYGAMGVDPVINGLKEAMGITVPKEIKELRW